MTLIVCVLLLSAAVSTILGSVLPIDPSKNLDEIVRQQLHAWSEMHQSESFSGSHHNHEGLYKYAAKDNSQLGAIMIKWLRNQKRRTCILLKHCQFLAIIHRLQTTLL